MINCIIYDPQKSRLSETLEKKLRKKEVNIIPTESYSFQNDTFFYIFEWTDHIKEILVDTTKAVFIQRLSNLTKNTILDVPLFSIVIPEVIYSSPPQSQWITQISQRLIQNINIKTDDEIIYLITEDEIINLLLQIITSADTGFEKNLYYALPHSFTRYKLIKEVARAIRSHSRVEVQRGKNNNKIKSDWKIFNTKKHSHKMVFNTIASQILT